MGGKPEIVKGTFERGLKAGGFLRSWKGASELKETGFSVKLGEIFSGNGGFDCLFSMKLPGFSLNWGFRSSLKRIGLGGKIPSPIRLLGWGWPKRGAACIFVEGVLGRKI